MFVPEQSLVWSLAHITVIHQPMDFLLYLLLTTTLGIQWRAISPRLEMNCTRFPTGTKYNHHRVTLFSFGAAEDVHSDLNDVPVLCHCVALCPRPPDANEPLLSSFKTRFPWRRGLHPHTISTFSHLDTPFRFFLA